MLTAPLEASELRSPLSAASPTPHPPEGRPPGFRPLSIRTDRCKGCELCVAACPHQALALDRSAVNPLGYHPVRLIDPAACTSCAICARVCPDTVFTVYAPPRLSASRPGAAASAAVAGAGEGALR